MRPRASIFTTTVGDAVHPLEDTENLVTARLVMAFSDFEERVTALVRHRLPPDEPDADLRAAVIAGAALTAVRAVLRARRAAGIGDEGPAPLLRAFGMLREIGQSAGPAS